MHLLREAEMLSCKRFKKKNLFLSFGCQQWVIIKWNNLRIRFPSLEIIGKLLTIEAHFGHGGPGGHLQWHLTSVIKVLR